MKNPKRHSELLLFLFLAFGGRFLFAEGKSPEPPSLESSPFSVESSPESGSREVSSNEANDDLLGELEKLLDNPAQRDAKEQLGLPELVEQKPLVEPIPKLTLKKPEEKKIFTEKKKSEEKPILPEQKKLAQKTKLPERKKPEQKIASQVGPTKKGEEVFHKKAIVKSLAPPRNEILSVDFYPQKEGHELVIKMTQKPQYRMVSNEKKKRFSFVFERTVSSKALRRQYDTKEFKSPLASYSVAQLGKGKAIKTHLVLQMRDWTAPKVKLSGTAFKLEFVNPQIEEPSRKVASELPENSLDQDLLAGNYNFKGAPLEKLELKNTDVREAIRLVARASGYNVVIGEDVKGNIGSLSLEDIPWDQAFYLILQSKKLGFIRRGNIVRVATLETLKTEREEIEKQEDVEPLRTVLIPISYAKANTLAPRAQPFLSKRGKVDTDDLSNTIIVRDIARVIDRVQKLFAVLDTQPPAVSISAKFVEVKKTFLRTLGLGAFSMASQTSGVNLGFNGPSFAPGGSSGTINLSAPRFAALNASLSLGESDSMVKVLANPTITVQQGQKGSILQGKTTEVPQAVAGAGATTTALTQTANLSLDVTPIVANDGSISLETNLLQEIPLQVTGALAKDTRSLKTQIILQNGDTAVLGGIVAGQEDKSNAGVPFLRNVPLLGLLFSQQKTSAEQNEVVIFITARILNSETAFKQTL